MVGSHAHLNVYHPKDLKSDYMRAAWIQPLENVQTIQLTEETYTSYNTSNKIILA